MSQAGYKISPEQEEMHRAAEARIQNFFYVKPELPESANKGLVRLCGSDIMKGVIQIIQDGGENTLHFHAGMDSFWMVLKGRVRFYGPEDKLLGEYGPNEGLVTPRGARYWFEKASDGDLELLQIASYEHDTTRARRIAVDESAPKSNRNQWFDGQSNNALIDKTQA